MSTTSAVRELTDLQVASYRENGFIHLPQVLTPAEVERYRDAAKRAYDEMTALNGDDAVFKQIIQVWEADLVLRELTMHPLLAGLARQLSGIDLRLWHDQLLIKKPHNGAATEFHQDEPYWPHASSRHALSAWIALVDVPVERGCMTFIPGSQQYKEVQPVDLHDHRALMEAAPELAWQPRVTVPLRAGDCTFHNSFLAHTANANNTDEFRYAMVNIYMDTNTTYDGKRHPVTDPLNLEIGQRLPEEQFPAFD